MRERVPEFAICPPPRCFHREQNDEHTICGELARWKRPGADYLTDAFYCDKHRLETDEQLAGAFVVRRVKLTVDVLFAGASVSHELAKTEALAHLEQAIAAAGGILDVQMVGSTIGRYGPSPHRTRTNETVGDRR